MKEPAVFWQGIDYSALVAVFTLLGIDAAAFPDTFQRVRAIEQGALRAFYGLS